MDDLVAAVFWLAVFVVPMAIFLRAVRRPEVTRRGVLVATTFGGLTIGILAGLGLALGGTSFAFSVQLVAGAAGAGLFVGIAGLFARAVGGWLSRAP